MFDSDAEGGEQSPDGGGAIGPRRAVQVDQTRDGQKTITSDTCSAANIPRCQTIPGEPKNWRCRTLLYRMLHEHYLASWWPRKRLHDLIMSEASGYR